MSRETVIEGVRKGCASIKDGKNKLHKALLEVMFHIVEHGDWTVANTAVQEIRDYEGNMSFEAACAVKWFVKFGGLEHDGKDFIRWSGADYIRKHVSEAKEKPYYSQIKIENPFSFSSTEKIHALVKSIENARKKARKAELLGDDSVDVVINEDQVAVLKALVSGNAEIIQALSHVATGDYSYTDQAA